jgi:hypothetical protein
MKAFVVFILLVAVTMVGGWYAYQSSLPTPGSQLLSYVPSDTIFFTGYVRPPTVRKLLATWRKLKPAYASNLIGRDPRQATAAGGPAAGVLAGVLRRWAMVTADAGGWPFAIYGLPRGGVMVAYTVGTVPVVRWQLAHPQAFWDTVDAAEQMADVQGQSEFRSALRLRRYAFGSGENRQPLELIIATGNGFGVATLATTGIDEKTLGEVLGVTKPAHPLDTAELDTLAGAYGLIPGTVGFIDHLQLLAGLSGAPGNGLGKIVDSIAAWAGADMLFPSLRTSECLEDANVIASIWPRTITGVSVPDETTDHLSQRLVIEISDEESLARVERLRGHIPEVVWSLPGIVGIGLGVELFSLAPVAEDLEWRINRATFRCAPLSAVQRLLVRAGTAGLDFATDVLEDTDRLEDTDTRVDVKGVAMVLSDVQPRNDPVVPAAGDGVFVITAERPEAVWQMVQSVVGSDVDTVPEMGGEPAVFPPHMTRGRRVRAFLREQQLAVVVGDAKLPEQVDGKPEVVLPNGLFALRYRNRGGRRTIVHLMEGLPVSMDRAVQQAFRETMEALGVLSLSLALSLDVVKTGLVVDVTATPGA